MTGQTPGTEWSCSANPSTECLTKSGGVFFPFVFSPLTLHSSVKGSHEFSSSVLSILPQSRSHCLFNVSFNVSF